MSWSSLSRIGYSSGSYRTYGGEGQFVTRPAPTAEYIRRLKLPNASGVLLATLTATKRLAGGEIFQFGLEDPGGMDAMRVFDLPLPPNVVSMNHGPTLTEVTISASYIIHPLEIVVPGTWAQWGTRTYVHPPAGRSFTSDIFTATIPVPCSTKAKTFRDQYWEPRLLTAPNVSLRIEENFGGIGQIGGGKMTLANTDGFFDDFDECTWDDGIVTLDYGLDLPDGEMDEADYQIVGSWRVESVERTDTRFEVTLKELKSKADTSLPSNLFAREDYPSIANDLVGKPIPFAYGRIKSAKAIVIDRTLRTFKVAAHRIRSFDGVKIQQTVKEASDAVVTSWAAYSADTWFSVFNDTILNVTFDSTELTERKSIASVDANAGSWYDDGGQLYVRPPGTSAIDQGTVTVRRERSLTIWVQSNFASVDVARAEFTLGDDWDRSAAVAVDFSGRLKADGGLIENWADIVADLLDVIGETQFDLESFNRSRRAFAIGNDRFGFEAATLAASLYIDKATKAREILSDICRVAGAYLYVDAQGSWRFQVFRPDQGANLSNDPGHPPHTFDQTDLLDPLTKTENSRKIFSRVVINFAERFAEEWKETITEDRVLNRYLHGRNDIDDEVRDAPLATREDAIYYAQRLLSTEGPGITTYRVVLPRSALLLYPGDQIILTHTRYALNQVFECLAVDKDFVGGTVKVTLGNRRGWGDSFGWWVMEEASITPPAVPASALWLKHEGLSQMNEQVVALWSDLSGNGRDFISNTSGARPILRTNQINGLPALRFDTRNFAVGMWLARTSFASAFTAGEIFVVVKMDADPPTTVGSGLWNFSSPGLNQLIATDGTVKETFGTSAQKNTAINPALSFTSWRIYNVISASGEYTINLDGTQIYTTAVNTVQFASGASAYSIGGVLSSSNPFIGDIAEIVMFPRKLTTTERAGVFTYLDTRFALGIGAPAAGPLAWDAAWTDDEVAFQRQNKGFWHNDEGLASQNVTTAGDIRSFETSRWW
jgi:hypothetical protein